MKLLHLPSFERHSNLLAACGSCRRGANATFLAAATWGLLSLCSGSSLAYGQIGPDQLLLGVQTDSLVPVAGAKFTVAQEGLGLSGDCNNLGVSPVLGIDWTKPTALILDEVQVFDPQNGSSSITIGQQLVIPAGTFTGGSNWSYYYFQPTAKRITYGGTALAGDPESGWCVIPADGSRYSFETYSAELPTPQVVAAYFAYHTGSVTDQYKHGVLFRMDTDVDLGADLMDINISAEGYGHLASSPPEASAIYVGDNPSGSGLVIHGLKMFVEDDGPQLVIRVGGRLRVGDNLILIRKTGNATVRKAVDVDTLKVYPVGVTPEPCGTGGVPPPGNSDCPAGACVPGVQCGPVTCENNGLLIGVPLCMACGTSLDVSSCLKGGGGMQMEFGKAGISKIVGLKVSASGEVGGEFCIGYKIEGGYCASGYVCTRVCKALCHVKKKNWLGFTTWKDQVVPCLVKDPNGSEIRAGTKSCKAKDC